MRDLIVLSSCIHPQKHVHARRLMASPFLTVFDIEDEDRFNGHRDAVWLYLNFALS